MIYSGRAAIRSRNDGSLRKSRHWLTTVIVAMLPVLNVTAAFANVTEPATPAEQLRIQARAFEHGEGVPRNVERAIALYCDAARTGDAEAQYSLGWIYANGRGVGRDESTAAFYFTLAAQQGHREASKMLRYVGSPQSEGPACLRPAVAATEPQADGQAAQNELAPLEEFVPATAAQKKAMQLVNELAPQFGVFPRLALAVIRAESNFDAAARSPKNAQGLMQLIPETSARFNVTKPYEAVQNVRGGLAYLRWLLAYFEGDVSLVAAAYNAGEGTVNRYRGVPPYPETRAYVKRIMQFFGREQHPYERAVTDPSPELPRIRRATADAPATVTGLGSGSWAPAVLRAQ